MDLHDGCVDALVNQGGLYRKVELMFDLQRQMLEALDYLSVLGLVHGDIKPGNILYSVRPSGRHNFILSDFDVSHSNDEAAISLGTEPFIAPELRRDRQTGQTSKADIWSLAVTILYVGSPVFRLKIRRENDVMDAIEAALEDSRFAHLRPMLKVDPAERASAADMLQTLNDKRHIPHIGRAQRSACRVRSRGPISEAPSLQDLHRPASPGSNSSPRRFVPRLRSLETLTRPTPLEAVRFLGRPVPRIRSLESLNIPGVSPVRLRQSAPPCGDGSLGRLSPLIRARSDGSPDRSALKVRLALSRKRRASSSGSSPAAVRVRRCS